MSLTILARYDFLPAPDVPLTGVWVERFAAFFRIDFRFFSITILSEEVGKVEPNVRQHGYTSCSTGSWLRE